MINCKLRHRDGSGGKDKDSYTNACFRWFAAMLSAGLMEFLVSKHQSMASASGQRRSVPLHPKLDLSANKLILLSQKVAAFADKESSIWQS
jgi:hypothetical protein